MPQATPASQEPPPGPERARDRAFRAGVVWNLASTLVLGLSGFALLALLGRLHGAEGLGVFAQVWAPYVIFGQLAVGGLDRSVLRALAERETTRASRAPLVWAAVLPALASSTLFGLGFYLARDAFAGWYRSPLVAEGIAAAAPGLACFGANKVLLGVVNGLRRMRAFAVYQSLRYVLMPVGALVADAVGLPASQASFLFTLSEGTLFVVLSAEVLVQVALPRLQWLAHVRGHVSYGLRSLASGVLIEVNSRVDVWMLGRFVGDASVGVYNAALQVAEGLFQVLIALQNNYNPLLASLLAARRTDELHQLVRRGGRRTFLAMGAVSVLAVAAFPLLPLLLDDPDFERSWLPFSLLMAGIWLSSARMPFFQTLLMAGRPGWHSVYMVSVVLVNVTANALLIPPLGIVGAALATASAFVAAVVLLQLAARMLLGVRL